MILVYVTLYNPPHHRHYHKLFLGGGDFIVARPLRAKLLPLKFLIYIEHAGVKEKLWNFSHINPKLFILQRSLFLCNAAECVLSVQLEMMRNVKKKKERKRREIQAGDVSVLKLPKKSLENNSKTRNKKLPCRMQHEKCDLFELSTHRINYVYIYISGLLWLNPPPTPPMYQKFKRDCWSIPWRSCSLLPQKSSDCL